MEDKGMLRLLLQAGNRQPLRIRSRITAGCENDTDGRFIAPFQLQLIQSAFHCCKEYLQQIGLETREHDLRLRIAESGIELNRLRLAVRRNHQSGEQDAAERTTFRNHRLRGRQ